MYSSTKKFAVPLYQTQSGQSFGGYRFFLVAGDFEFIEVDLKEELLALEVQETVLLAACTDYFSECMELLALLDDNRLISVYGDK